MQKTIFHLQTALNEVYITDALMSMEKIFWHWHTALNAFLYYWSPAVYDK
jgi:hypothetical protein